MVHCGHAAIGGFRTSKYRNLALSAAIAMCGINVNAAYICSGKVAYTGIDVGGDVTVRLTSTPVQKICNINGSAGRASAGVCKSFYATILLAKTQGKSISIYYDDNGYNCSSLPSWGFIGNSVYFVQGPDDE